MSNEPLDLLQWGISAIELGSRMPLTFLAFGIDDKERAAELSDIDVALFHRQIIRLQHGHQPEERQPVASSVTVKMLLHPELFEEWC